MIPTPVWKSSYRLIFADKAADARRLGHRRQHHRRGLDQGAAVAGLRPADLVHQPAVRAEVRRAAGGRTGRRPRRAGRWSTRARSRADGGEDGVAGNRADGRGPADGDDGRSAAPVIKAECNVRRRRCSASPPSSIVGRRHRRANWATCSNTASRSRSPSARTNPPCCPSCSRRSTRANCSIYSDHGSQHPTNAAELTNTTGKTLDGGPITVYDGGAYGGEALMETLKAGDKRLISYAVDLGTRITEAFGSKQAVVREIHASRGILTIKYGRRRDPDLHHPQRRSEGQDADHRASRCGPATRCSTRSRRRRPPPPIASK